MFTERIALGLPSLAGYGLFESLNTARELGFQSVMNLVGGPETRHSLGEFASFGWYEMNDKERNRLRKALEHFKHISVHQAWDNEWQKWIDCADYLGSEIVTIHAGLRKPGETLEQLLERSIPLYQQIGCYAQSKGIKIGLENGGGRYCDYLSQIEAVNHPMIGATIDVGHCAYFTEVSSATDYEERVRQLNETIYELLLTLGAKVYHFHLHNVQPREKVDLSMVPSPFWKDETLIDHRCVSEGLIDFQRLFNVLEEIDYRGLFDIELEEREREKKAFESGRYLDELIGRR